MNKLRYGLVALIFLIVACGGGTSDVLLIPFGDTTLVIVLNPEINDVDEATLETPGTNKENITLNLDDGPSTVTDADGLGVLTPVPAGMRTLTLDGSGVTGSVDISIADQDLREVVIAADGSGASIISNVLYPFSADTIEVTPDMTVAEVNDALSLSNVIVFFVDGTYTGDLIFSGSNVTLFGEGEFGGTVTLDGNITVDGSSNRVRGATITGDLTISGSDAGISFSRVEGATTVDGSSASLIMNEFCGSMTVNASDLTALGNEGLAPLPTPSDCP